MAAETIDPALQMFIVKDEVFLLNHVVPGTWRICTTPIIAGKVAKCEHGWQFVREGDYESIRAREVPA